MNVLDEAKWLKKRIAEYRELVASAKMTQEEAEKKVKPLVLRLNELAVGR